MFSAAVGPLPPTLGLLQRAKPMYIKLGGGEEEEEEVVSYSVL
jgi:hypothetical protein